MVRQAKFTAAALSLIGLLGVAACSGGEGEASVVREAYAGTPPINQPDYGWRTNAAATAERDGTVFEYY